MFWAPFPFFPVDLILGNYRLGLSLLFENEKLNVPQDLRHLGVSNTNVGKLVHFLPGLTQRVDV